MRRIPSICRPIILLASLACIGCENDSKRSHSNSDRTYSNRSSTNMNGTRSSDTTMYPPSQNSSSATNSTNSSNNATSVAQSPARTTAEGGTWANSTPASADQNFVQEAMSAGAAEVQLGKLALERSSNASVRSFAQRMVNDHQAATEKLKQAVGSDASKYSAMNSPSSPPMADNLKSLSGSDFDKAYIKMMVQDHSKVVKKFEEQAQSGQNAALRTYARDTLPTLREHLKMAQSVASELGVSAS